MYGLKNTLEHNTENDTASKTPLYFLKVKRKCCQAAIESLSRLYMTKSMEKKGKSQHLQCNKIYILTPRNPDMEIHVPCCGRDLLRILASCCKHQIWTLSFSLSLLKSV